MGQSRKGKKYVNKLEVSLISIFKLYNYIIIYIQLNKEAFNKMIAHDYYKQTLRKYKMKFINVNTFI